MYTVPAFAEAGGDIVASGTCGANGDNLTWTLTGIDEYTLTISGSGAMKDYAYNNTSPWYSYRKNIKTVVIEDGVTSVGQEAFNYCSAITDISISKTVASIGLYAFYGCESRESITIDENNPVLSDGDANAIIETASDRLILGCKNTLIPDYIKIIGDSAFMDCIGLTSIEIPDSVISIEGWAFCGCTDLTDVDMSISVSSIGECAFMSCSSLTSIDIPESVTTLSRGVFSGTGLTSIVLPEGLTTIGEEVFNECRSLVSIVIPDSVTSIGSAFLACTNLKNIVYYGRNLAWDKISIDYNDSFFDNALRYDVSFVDYSQTNDVNLMSVAVSQGSNALAENTDYSIERISQTEDPCSAWEIKVSFIGDHKDLPCVSFKGKASHQLVFIEGHDATCLEEGNLECWHCSRCGKYFYDEEGTRELLDKQRILSPLGHSWDEGTITKEATPTEEGVKTYKCTRCGLTRVETLPMIRVSITVTFDAEGGSLPQDQLTKVVTSGEPYGALPVPEREGYTFAGWQDINGTVISEDSIVESTADQEFFALWEANTYTVHFDGNSNTAGTMEDQTGLKYDEEYVLNANGFTRTGYEFTGWNTSADGTGTAYADGASIISLTGENGGTAELFAQWELKEYTITYVLKGGTNNADNPEHFYYTSETITLKNPTRTGYTFNGWYTTSSYKTKVTTIKTGTTKDVKLYAKWTLKAPTSLKWAKYGTGTKKIKLSWKANSAADGYAVYRATKKSGTYKLLGTTTDTAYTNKKLTPGKTYYYKVRSYTLNSSGKKVYSAYTKIVKGTTLDPADYKSYIISDFRWVKRNWSHAKAVEPGAYCSVFYNYDGDKCVLTYLCYKIGNNKKVWKEWYMHNLTGDLCPARGTDPEDFYDAKSSNAFGKAKLRYMKLKDDVLTMKAEILKAKINGSNTEKVFSRTAKYVNSHG